MSTADGGMVVEARYARPTLAHPFFCGLTTGYWAMVPSLFGAVGVATEISCQSHGDAVCRIHVGWEGGAAAAPEQATAAAREADHALERFEAMQAMAEELTRSGDLPTLVERILECLDRLLHAPRVVVVHQDARETPFVGTRGLPDGAGEPAAHLLLEDAYDGRHGVAVLAPLGSVGVIALLLPDEVDTTVEQRQLRAFARHASAAVERCWRAIRRSAARRRRARSSCSLVRWRT